MTLFVIPSLLLESVLQSLVNKAVVFLRSHRNNFICRLMGQCISKVNSHSRSRRSRQSTQETTNLSVRPSVSDIHQRNIPVVLSHESQIMQRDNNRCIEGNMSTNHYPMEQRNRHAHENSLSNHLRDQEKHISRLVLDTLRKIRTMIDSDHPPPQSLLNLHRQAESEDGWLMVLRCVIDTIPVDDPLGPAVINLIIEECPLPSKESITNLWWKLELVNRKNKSVQVQCNILVVLSCLAEKMAGPGSIALLTIEVRDYILASLDPSNDPHIILFALVALEKFAQTSENKRSLLNYLTTNKGKNFSQTLKELDQWWLTKPDFMCRQVGFCAKWCLDNIFIIQDRLLSYEEMSLDGINALLNNKDVSEYLKISPDGLEARCDALSFESVRCTHHSDDGVWYYEVLIITSGVMQIGWATKDSKFLNHEGYGIGDDEYSVAFDGCRKLVWYNAQSELIDKEWKPGDILGVLLDLIDGRVVFSINGEALPAHTKVFSCAKHGFFAAASFMSFQQCRFNFGSTPMRYPPAIQYKVFNDVILLKPEEKIILPRHLKIQAESQLPFIDDACTVCCAKKASVVILPCKHRGFCFECTMQLENCPMCREFIQNRVKECEVSIPLSAEHLVDN